MKILSLNVNNFCGPTLLKQNSSPDIRQKYCLGILDYIRKNEADLIILQEFPYRTEDASFLIVEMLSDGYRLVHRKTEWLAEKNDTPMTVMFVRKELDCELIEPYPLSMCLRSCLVRVNDMMIYGIHAPALRDEKGDRVQMFWKWIVDFFKEYKDKKALVIGDTNINKDKETIMACKKKYKDIEYNYEGYKYLLDECPNMFFDMGVNCVGDEEERWVRENTATVGSDLMNGNLRLDRVLGNNLIVSGYWVTMDNRTKDLDCGITNHSALILDINE